MIILATNVVSEPMRNQGSDSVKAWLDAQVPETLFLASTSLSELMLGIELPPRGKRRSSLAASLGELLSGLFESRIPAFDFHAALAYAQLVGHARSTGRTISVSDGQIAAIAAVHGCSVATRDTELFMAAGLKTINPWLHQV